MSSVVSELEVLIAAETGDLTSKLSQADREIQTFAKNGSAAGKKLTRALAVVSGGLIGVAGFAVDASIKFESAFADVEKTVNATDEELAALRQTIRDMATDTDNPLSALENAHETIAQIAASGGALGIATEDLQEFTQTVGALDVASDLTADSAATFLATFANVTGLEVDKFDNAADAIVTLGNSMAATESQITSFANRLAPLETFGFSPDEILGYSAAMASLGLSSELGSTNLLKTISDINVAVAEGGTDLQNFADVAGLTADEFAEMVANDPTGSLNAFLAGLAEMDASEAITALNELNITSQEQQSLLLRMAAGLDTVNQGLETSEEAFKGNGAAMEEAAAKADTTAGKMQRLRNNVNDLGITIGDELTPGLADVSDGLVLITQGNHEEGFAKIGEGIAGLVQGITDLAGLDIDVSGGLEAFFTGVGGLAGLWWENLKADTETGLAAFQQGIEDGGTALTIILDRIGRGIQVFVLDATARFIDFAQGFRQMVLDATGGQIDIAPDLNITSADIHAQLDNFTIRDSITAALYDQLATGEPIDLSGIEIPLGGDFNIDFASMLGTPQAEGLVQNAGAEFTMAIQDALGSLMETALTSADPAAADAAIAQYDMLVPVAMELGIDPNQVAAQVSEKLMAASEAIEATTSATPTPITQAMSVTPLIDPFLLAGEIMGVVEAIPYTATISDTMFVVPLLDEAQVTGDTQAIVEGYAYGASANTDLVVIPKSVDVSAAVLAVQMAVSSALQTVGVGVNIVASSGGGVSASVGMGVPSHHTGGVFEPEGGGQEGFAWLKRGETVRTEAQEAALNRAGSGGGGNTFNVYGSSPYEVAAMVARAERDRGYGG